MVCMTNTFMSLRKPLIYRSNVVIFQAHTYIYIVSIYIFFLFGHSFEHIQLYQDQIYLYCKCSKNVAQFVMVFMTNTFILLTSTVKYW